MIMPLHFKFQKPVLVLFASLFLTTSYAQSKAEAAKVEAMKTKALQIVESKAKNIQEMVDMVFSFGELGFQEIETSKYLTGILEKNGFTIERNLSGIPT
jgi:aminobenzoyl-glutamate utilization protein B